MYDFLLSPDSYFDFKLSDDAVEFIRDYSQYELFYIDTNKSLYSTGGTIPQNQYKSKYISLTGYDNGFLPNILPTQYSGVITANSPYSYNFSGDNTWAYISNDQTSDYPGFSGSKNLLIEFKPPIINNSDDGGYFVVFDSTGNTYIYTPFNYINSSSSGYGIYSNNSEFTDVYYSGDTISFFVNNNIMYLQKNGVTLNTLVNNNPSSDYKFECGFYSSVSGVTYTINDLMCYFQTCKYTGDTQNISGLTIPTTGITYTFGKTPFKLLPVTGTTNTYNYDINPKNAEIANKPYNQLLGGFYQGSFKLFDQPIQYFNGRYNKGWTVNQIITITVDNSELPKLNDLHNYGEYIVHQSEGILFYLGTRAENKFFELNPDTIDTLISNYGINDNIINDVSTQKIYQINTETNGNIFDKTDLFKNDTFTLNGEDYNGFYNITNNIYYSGRTSDTSAELNKIYDYSDIINNSFCIFLHKGKIGYRTIYKTDPCYSGEVLDPLVIDESSFQTINDDSYPEYEIRKIITKKFTIENIITTSPVINNNDLGERFLFITTVFERDLTYDTNCDISYGDDKKGTLKIYINGNIVFSYDKFTEPIPHELDVNPYLQEDVSFNISLGGGTQGLVQTVNPYGIEPPTKIIDKFFTSSFIGGVCTLQMYSIPLDITEIKKEFYKIKNEYNIYAPEGGRQVRIKTGGY